MDAVLPGALLPFDAIARWAGAPRRQEGVNVSQGNEHRRFIRRSLHMLRHFLPGWHGRLVAAVSITRHHLPLVAGHCNVKFA